MEEPREQTVRRQSFVGTAKVAGASFSEQGTTLKLETFAGESVKFRVPTLPNDAGAQVLYSNSLRPISVKIQRGGDHCTAIALSPDGPQCSIIPLNIALALLHRGVHAVVDGGLHSDVPCSTNMHEHEVPR